MRFVLVKGIILSTEFSASSNNETLFSNQSVPVEDISTKQLPLIALSPKYRTINLIWGVCFGSLFAIILFVLSSDFFFTVPEKAGPLVLPAYALILFFTIWHFVYHFFADPIKKYSLREHDLNYHSGLIFRSLVSQPILRIQHIEIKRGPIERKAGLATLQVFSAGGISHTFYIPGLEYEHAVRLRQFILDHKDLAADV